MLLKEIDSSDTDDAQFAAVTQGGSLSVAAPKVVRRSAGLADCLEKAPSTKLVFGGVEREEPKLNCVVALVPIFGAQ